MVAMARSSISVVIPAYNEEVCIEQSILSLAEELCEFSGDFEIVVVDDASTDSTRDILERLKKQFTYLKSTSHKKNKGLGSTLRTGFDLASKELTFYTDADLPVDFREVQRAVRIMRVQHADLVTGFRHDRTSEGMIRIIYSFIYNLLIRVFFGILVRDVNFSFKLFKTEQLRQMRLKSNGSFIDAEIMIKAHRMGLFVCQIGIDYFKRRVGVSRLSGVSTILKIIKEAASQHGELRRIGPDSKH